MLDKILIANRGEIACRVIRTAKELGVATVAVYSDADVAALHVEMADEAVRLGPAPAADSYLRADAILEAAARTGAQAIHPGYGFLSENADFAKACEKAGVVFIGPPASAIRAMGSKSSAKALMERAGVPVVPGYHGDEQEPKVLSKEAERIGYPVLIKASAGGGGKGMRLVEGAKDFADALASARREAKSAFGDDHVLVEKFVTNPRHIEVQVFADSHGDAVHLFERDCSVQRRHQKVLEEAPAPGLSAARREEMGRAAVEAAKAIGYVGAGTVEFISSGGEDFYFMEMNTRLQVEHPVTELVTGQDLVGWQLRVASGERLPVTQSDLSLNGHAIEARLYAEDPASDFLPSTGQLTHLRLPEGGATGPVRIDSGVRGGDAVSPHYDPMIAKVIAWGPDRGEALRRLDRALADTEVVGVATNRDFLRRAVTHSAFAKGGVDTGFIAAHAEDLLPEAAPVPDDALAIAALFLQFDRADKARAAATASGDPHSPWALLDGWRVNDETHAVLPFETASGWVEVRYHYGRAGIRLELPGGTVAADAELLGDGRIAAILDGRRRTATVVEDGLTLSVFLDGARHMLERIDPLAGKDDIEVAGGALTAPMSGKIIAVMAEAGASVERGAPLLVLEAMKMEHTIAAPADGTVIEICFQPGEQVDEGALLVEFERTEDG